MGIDISGGVKIIPKRREPQTVYNPVTQVTPIKQPANDFSNFYSPAAPLVKNAVLNAMNSDAKPAAAVIKIMVIPRQPVEKNSVI